MTISIKNISIGLLFVSCVLGITLGLVAIISSKEIFVFPSILLGILTLFISIYIRKIN